ncbi:hypothetical protein Tco_0595816 [Tanacetum coccineum]
MMVQKRISFSSQEQMQSSFLGWKSRDITNVECLMVHLLKLRLTLQRLEARYKYFPNTVPKQQIKNYDRFLEGILLCTSDKRHCPCTSGYSGSCSSCDTLPQAAQPAAGLPDMGSNASEPTRNDSVYERSFPDVELLASQSRLPTWNAGQSCTLMGLIWSQALCGNLISEKDKHGASSTPLRFKCMTRSSTKELLSPFENPEQKISSKRRLFDTPSLVESNSPEFDHNFDILEQSKEEGQFLKELRDNTFSGSEHEDSNEHEDATNAYFLKCASKDR